MTGLPDPRHTVLIARTELRRAWRQFRGKGHLQQGVVVVAVLFGGLVTAGVAFGGFAAGSAVASGEIEAPMSMAALVPAGVFTGAVLFTTYLTAIQLGDIDQRDALLTTVSHADVAGGLLVSSFVRIGGLFVVPAVIGAVGFAVGAGSPVTFPLVAGSLLVVVLTAFVLGFGAGIGLTHVFGQSEVLVRHRLALGTIAFLGYVWLLVTNRFGDVIEPVVVATRRSPVAWFADLALLAIVPTADPVHAVVAAVGGVVVLVSGIWAVVWVAGVHWYADPVDTGEPRHSSVSHSPLSRVIGRPAAWVTTKSWLRARRAPVKLVYVVYPVFLLFQPVQSAIQSGTVPPTLPAVVAVYGAWATGAAFSLNPLGDEGAVLPITVTSGADGRTVVTGLLAAGLIPGIPITVGLTAASAVASSVPPVAVVGLTVGALALCVGAAGMATGIGVAFPRFEAARVARSRSVVVPSTWGFLTYSVVLLVLAAPATAAQVPVVTDVIATRLGLTAELVRIGGIGLAVLLVAPTAWYATRFAARRFDTYTIE